MEITMTTSEVINKYQAIEQIISNNEDLPIELAWNIEDNQEEFKHIVDKFEAHRQKLITPLQEKGAFVDNNDGTMTVKEEFREEFLKNVSEEIDKLLLIENSIDIKTCKKNTLPKQIRVSDLRAIKFMIIE